ncbi:replication factor RFC1 C terminal domain-domain-containing protein [Absidia repens]|uniref:Replication factor C subunit 1 n=1 Tax=Absidia repens TaxID=90262 RepID=A0A1X2IZ27_9FUNG|nr:replication factor RFC1 C terminal domain-domain-containing protein [Absidia repens]
MAGIKSAFKKTPKKVSGDSSKRKKLSVQNSEDDDDFATPPPNKKIKEEISQYVPSKSTMTETINDNEDGTRTESSHQPTSHAPSSKSTLKYCPSIGSKRKAPTPATTKSKSQSKITYDADDLQQPKTGKELNTKPGSKSGYYQLLHRAPPSALGSRPKPIGKEGCLANMTFVLSGEFDTITKDDIKDIIKTYGGRVTTAVSGKTTYLLRGRDAGQSKLDKANSLKTKILDEDGFYDIVEKSAGEKERGSTPVESTKASTTKSSASKSSSKLSKPKPSTSKATAGDSTPSNDILWTEKYKPKTSADIIGNKSIIGKLSSWLGDWQANRQKNFPEGEGSQGFRAALLSGPPGIGKTTAAQLLAKEHGYTAMELNASDTRNKKILGELVQETTFNRSMTEFFSADSTGSSVKVNKLKSADGKLVLIMDEVDGMSSGDRGGSAELARLIRSTNIPIICICNDIRSDKVKPLLKVCFEAKFTRTPARTIRPKLMKIAQSENLTIEPNAIDELVAATGNDIRQVINILSTYRLCSNDMKFGDAKSIGSQNQKYSQISLFEIPVQLLGNSRWQHPNMNQLADIYFHDYTLSHLIIYENYTKSSPAKAYQWNQSANLKEIDCLEMELFADAANAIADGDLVDSRIGKYQEYSLMPVHSIFSCVRPAYYVQGNLGGNRMGFPQWLGQNSKTLKNMRLLADIQNKLRSKATVDLSEVRYHYVPALTCNLFTDIANGDYEKAMDTMDYYYLDRENLETLSDIALSEKPAMNTLSAGAKRNFNKAYKGRVHPILFQLDDTSPLKSKIKAPKEDLEGVIFDVEPEAAVGSDDEGE